MGACSPQNIVRLSLLIALMRTTNGLEFSLSHSTSDLPGRRTPCGVLLCTENRPNTTGNVSLPHIVNMTVFKTIAPSLGRLGSSEPARLTKLATVSSTQPNLDQVANGMTLSGLFTNMQVNLKIELYKETDCMGEFTCVLTEINAQGEKVIYSHRLLPQRPKQETAQIQETGLTPLMLMKQLTAMEELNVKISLIANNVERLENNVHAIDDKVCQLDSKLSAVDSEAIQEKVLGKIKAQIDDHFSKVLNASKRTDDILKTTSTLLTSLSSQNKEFQNNVMESYKDLFDNVTWGLDEVFTRNIIAADAFKSNLVSFTEDVDRSWRMLESSTNTSSDKTLDAFQTVVLNLNKTLVAHIESVLKDFFLPTSCEKGTAILFRTTSTPYPVIYKSNIKGLDGPLLCDTETDQGGWIVIQRRSTGNVDFYRDWAAYKEGFGSINDDFWLGNEKIYLITNSGKYELRIELKYRGRSKYAVYDRFSLSGEDEGYKLSVGAYSGTAGDGLFYHNNMKFTTIDKDNDVDTRNCAQVYTGAWWYKSCHQSNLNGKWGQHGEKGPAWYTFILRDPASFTEMKIRRVKNM